MSFLTDEKLVIVGAGGAIGSTMVQTALTMKLTPNVCLYDVYAPGMEGVIEEMFHCGYDGVNLTATTDVAEAFKDAKYIISSGGAPRKAGMTREDLLAGNCAIAKELGENIKKYCPDLKHLVVIFNPADLTGLVALLYSGLKPSQVTTLAALDSTRLQSAIAKKFGVKQYEVTGCKTYGGHGEQMAVFGSAVKVAGKPLNELIGTEACTAEDWEQIKLDTTKGGAKIIELRGRSSWQSPAYCSVEMVRAVMGGEAFRWPAGTYVCNEKYNHIMMAMETHLGTDGCTYTMPQGTPEELAKLDASYEHLCKMRDELVTLNIVPAISEWSSINPNL
ncbi:MAG: malate dehydrogenase [Paludibacteraceae bacterium]|nr:malate dehydrogenase [Paludibacteraceae bacterium]